MSSNLGQIQVQNAALKIRLVSKIYLAVLLVFFWQLIYNNIYLVILILIIIFGNLLLYEYLFSSYSHDICRTFYNGCSIINCLNPIGFQLVTKYFKLGKCLVPEIQLSLLYHLSYGDLHFVFASKYSMYFRNLGYQLKSIDFCLH